MIDVALNILVAFVTVNTVVMARFTIDERRQKASKHGAPYVLWAMFAGFAATGLWIWVAFLTDQWQFAAVVAAPLLITVGSFAARPKASAR